MEDFASLRSIIDGSLLRALILLLTGGFQRALDSLEIPGNILCLWADCHFSGEWVQSFHQVLKGVSPKARSYCCGWWCWFPHLREFVIESLSVEERSLDEKLLHVSPDFQFFLITEFFFFLVGSKARFIER